MCVVVPGAGLLAWAGVCGWVGLMGGWRGRGGIGGCQLPSGPKASMGKRGVAFGACSNRVLPEAARDEAFVEAGAVAPRANTLVVIMADDLGGVCEGCLGPAVATLHRLADPPG